MAVSRLFVLEPEDKAAALARWLASDERLSPEERAAFGELELERIEVEPARRLWRLVVRWPSAGPPPGVFSSDWPRRLSEALSHQLPAGSARLAVEVVGEPRVGEAAVAAAPVSSNGLHRPAPQAGSAEVVEPRRGEGPEPGEQEAAEPGGPEAPEPDDYMIRLFERAANGEFAVGSPNGGAGKPSRTAQAGPSTPPARGPQTGAGSGAVLGRPIDGKAVPIREIAGNGESVVVEGLVFSAELREGRNGSVLTLEMTDRTDSLAVKVFPGRGVSPSELQVSPGDWVRVRGRIQVDRFSGEPFLMPRDMERIPPKRREDTSPVKRVELHLHTKMSAMDGVTEIRDAVELAAAWGHPAVAVTDHGVVQAFPEAFMAASKSGIKLIFGMEGYLYDEAQAQETSGPAGSGGPTHHIILLAKNPTGLKNLYRLVSASHLDHFYRKPRIPRRLLEEYREGLILGSACEAGELYRAILAGRPEQEILRIARFYDYLEIQPRANNAFLVHEGRLPSTEALEAINRYICDLADRLGLPVVATGDVHFLDPEDEVFRRILMSGQGFSDAERQAPLYLRPTQEMLEEFAYLGEDRAHRAVVENPRRLAEMVEVFPPIPKGLHGPTVPEADRRVEELARRRARELYGDPLPALVAERLERELKAIIGNGFAPLYWIAHKLVAKSLEDGYLVGSRGSVGSSLVAMLCGITEVNPLPPHYACPGCGVVEFCEGEAGCGVDLPEKPCPSCGRPLDRRGFDIPFEVFMGFHGDKVPDIDLNFSGEYQPLAHRYAEELLGKERVFRAGTIATIADRTAYGFIRKYLEEKGIRLRTAEVNRLVLGCTGVRRTTGQHPGGLMVVPADREVYEFTPLQYPANDRESGVVTTHFDYHAIHDTLVKLDILGHDDPTVLRMLQDMTGVDVRQIPLDDPQTMAIFSGVEALGLSPEAIGTSVGTLGIPEYGTRFVRQMLEETRPKNFAELVRISGFSHGTNVWANNAQELIRAGTATLADAIATRDDIMIYLIRKGMDPSGAFQIMERVRKGKGLGEEEKRRMAEVGVPAWYIESCEKISYLFPKAHAVAYVTMAFRIAYFKVHHPAAFYATYFSVRAEEFDAGLALAGPERMRAAMAEMEAKPEATARDKNLVTILEVALEAAARGFRFLPVDLYRSDVTRFLPVGERELLPSLVALPGLGKAAAEAIDAARKERSFTSVEDLKSRARVNKAVLDVLAAHGCLKGLPETDQLTLF